MASGLKPHPLIVGLATRLVGDDNDEAAAGKNLGAVITEVRTRSADQVDTVTTAFASAAQLPELAIFSGFLGGTITRDRRTWRLLYQDPKALTWLLVEDDKIVWYDNVEDKSAPAKRRDVIWLKKETPVRQGVGPESDEARFLVGTFTNAGDLHASLSAASTAPPGSGILCAPTPECCTRHTNPLLR